MIKIVQNKLLGLICLILVSTSFSCNKYLDLKPQDGIIRQEFWKTKEQVQAAVFGCYASLLGSSALNDKALVEYLFLWGELRADMLTPSIGINFEEQDILNTNILSSNSITNWRSFYRTINYCNTVIAFAPEVLQNDNTFTRAALDAYVAEAKTLRALMYFYLARSFRDVPLKLTPTSSDDQLEQLPKNTGEEVLNQIVKDLNEAEPFAPVSYGSQASDKGRITRYTVNALQADVYLWMEKYNECIAACDKVISSGRFGLISGNNQNAWFAALYANGNSNESIFEFQFDRQKLNPFFFMFRTRARFIASGKVMEEIYQQDFLDDTKKDIRGDGAALRATDLVIWKYVAVDNNSLRTQEESYAHWIVYRYADILLMKAEALAQTDKGAEALALVKVIRDRARALQQTEKSPAVTDKEGISDYILEERAREFAFEGKRWYDVLRHSKRNNYARLNILQEMIAGSVAPDRQQSAIIKARDKNSHYFPIFDYELQTDRKLIQNPFYK